MTEEQGDPLEKEFHELEVKAGVAVPTWSDLLGEYFPALEGHYGERVVSKEGMAKLIGYTRNLETRLDVLELQLRRVSRYIEARDDVVFMGKP